jgi:predicted RNA-binding Zn-ribbon protein involved in translation (DUF1610 family)
MSTPQPTPINCTNCGRRFLPHGGVYGLMCPNCGRGQIYADPFALPDAREVTISTPTFAVTLTGVDE